MEATLWQDIAAFYQPELHNLAGPYDRAYGMDSEPSGGGAAGLMRYAVDAQGKPVPLQNSTGSGFSCPIAILGTRIPPDALIKLQKFQGDHFVRRQITDQRVATAWVGKNVIIGAEATSKTKDVGKKSQFRPVAIQWRTPSGQIGWIHVARSPMIDATADEKGVTISTTGTIRLRIHAKGLVPAQVGQALWSLPGLHVAVASDSTGNFTSEKADKSLNEYFEAPEDTVDVIYPGITRIRLDISAEK